MKSTLFLVFIICSNILYSQTTICGKVLNENKLPLEYFNVLLLHPKDSSLVNGGAFVDGMFKISHVKKDTCISKISSLGYLEEYISINTNLKDSINIGSIQLRLKVLDEVLIVGKRPVITRKDGNLLINVKNSSLSDAGNSLDVLQKSPGVILDKDNNILVLGKGTPVIFINNKEINSKSELELLQSYDIESIEIARNPRAEISASGHALIKITTKKIRQDKLNLLLYNNILFNRKSRNTMGIQFNSKLKRLENFFSYSFNDSKINYLSSGYEKKVIEAMSILNENTGTQDYDTKTHNLFYGTKYSINNRNTLGLQFSGSFSNANDSSFNSEEIKYNNVISKMQNTTTGKREIDFYDINLNYTTKLDSASQLFFITDYANKRLSSDFYISEKEDSDVKPSARLLVNSGKYHVFTGRLDYKRLLFLDCHMKAGLKYTSIKNDTKNDIHNKNTDNKTSSNTSISDHTKAVYLSIEREFKKTNLQLGVRYEYAKLKTVFDGNSNNQTILSSSNLFPSVLINRTVSENQSISLSYSKRIKRPSFQMTNPEIRYIDSLSYSVGNPNLKPTLSHNFELGLELVKNLSIAFDYSVENEKIVQLAINDAEDPRITKFTSININHAKSLSFNLSYNYSNKFYSNYSYIAISKPHIEILYLNENKTIKSTTWYFQLNNEFNLSRYIIMFIHFDYESSGYYDISHWKESYNLSAGFHAKIFKKKLLLSITVNDIFKTTSYSWKDQYLNIESAETSNRDYRWIKFSIRFNINKYFKKFHEESSNSSELDRL